ncbi:hypothetical protein C8A05DRAFT_17561 [Staphylotrichum tortipilum]|uniref:N-acetyltransferase domain-containing protein n=1 Tax=Staphylotrichum tortipilum TaxID=2831512 RepID=A0AAN6MGF1_9PEZI|nr:hypothetical protein C8A05DRAFT_17561 [Staphylotrichum longicolle]
MARGAHSRLEWRHRTLDYHISQVALRYPRTLQRNRATARHQKAVDTATGEILGYARWSIPESHATITTAESDGNGTPAWPEAVIPAVSAEEETEINRMAATAVWDPDLTSDPLLDGMRKIQDPRGHPGLQDVHEYKPILLTLLTSLIEGADTETKRAELEYLAVHPRHQRRGVATALVRSGMRQAEKLDLDIYVHAMKPGVLVYQRLGFRLERELIQDDTEYGGPGLFGDYFLIYKQPAKPAN